VSSDSERLLALRKAANPHGALISNDIPLRANLSLYENISAGLQFSGADMEESTEGVFCLLNALGAYLALNKRDDQLSSTERFIGKFLRVAVMKYQIILIERPALLLPDVSYATYLREFLSKISDARCKILPKAPKCCIIEYEWNRHMWLDKV